VLFTAPGLALMPSLLMARQSGAGMDGRMHDKMHRGMKIDTGALAREQACRNGISDPGCPNPGQDVPTGSNYYDHAMGLPLAQRP